MSQVKSTGPLLQRRSLKSLILNFSSSLTKAGSVESLLLFEDKEGSVFGRLISGDHKIGRIRSPAANNKRNNTEVSCLSFLLAYIAGVFPGMRVKV